MFGVDSVKSRGFVLFDFGGTLVDLRGIVAAMANRLETLRIRRAIPLALEWATGTAKVLPTAQGKKFRIERDIASDVLCGLLRKRGRKTAAQDAARLVVESWSDFVENSTLHHDAPACGACSTNNAPPTTLAVPHSG